MRRFPLLLAAVVASTASGCSNEDPYQPAEDGLREWLAAVHAGDAVACELMTTDFRDQLAPTDEAQQPTCNDVLALAGSDRLDGLPPSDAPMDVPAWDPSGEALVEITYAGQVTGFWMESQGEQWLVAGRAS